MPHCVAADGCINYGVIRMSLLHRVCCKVTLNVNTITGNLLFSDLQVPIQLSGLF